MSLKARLTPEQIQAIGNIKRKDIEPLPLGDSEKKALRQTIQEMQTAAAKEQNPDQKAIAQARVLGERINADAAGWMGILSKVPELGFQPQLLASSAAYTDPVRQTADFVAAHGVRPPQPGTPPGQLAERLEAMNQTRKGVEDGLIRLMRDPLLTWGEKDLQAAALVQNRAQLKTMTEVRGLDLKTRGQMLAQTIYGGATRNPDGRRQLQLDVARSIQPEQLPEWLHSAGLSSPQAFQQLSRETISALALQAVRNPDAGKAVDLYVAVTAGLGTDEASKAEVAYDLWRRLPSEQRDALPEALRRHWHYLFNRHSAGGLEDEQMDELARQARGQGK
jgi:hypothetical protein